MRGVLNHRLRVVVPLVAVAAVVGLTAGLGPTFRDGKPAAPPDGDASLLVLVHHKRADGWVDRHELLRISFNGSAPQLTETVWEGDILPFYSLGWHRIIDDRYVVAGTGAVIDVREKRAIHGGNSEGGRIESNSERVVSGAVSVRARENIVSFDLRTRQARNLTGPEAEPFALPGVRSPDGTKSVSWPNLDSNLTLHRVGHAPRPLGEFWVQETATKPNSGSPPPALWLDDERFLTQHGNGNLITVALDGTRTSLVRVPATKLLAGPPTLKRDPEGHIVFVCGLEAFLIDAEAKTWERAEWVSLGYGFDASWERNWRGRFAIRYEGREIGDSHYRPNFGGGSASTDRRLAIASEDRRVRVWSAGAGTWTVLDTPADRVVGWLK